MSAEQRDSPPLLQTPSVGAAATGSAEFVPTAARARPADAQHRAHTRERAWLARLHRAFWVAALLTGAQQAWRDQFNVHSDGLSYVEVGVALVAGDLATGVNAVWSPLYPWLLGMGLRLVQPTPYWEAPTVHAVTYLIYVGALAALTMFLRELVAFRRERAADPAQHRIAEWAVPVFGYTTFILSTRRLVSASYLTPDMLLAAFVFLVCALLLRIGRQARRGEVRIGSFVALGITLGVGYLAKAPFFPLAFIVLLVAAAIARFGARRAREAWVAPIVALLAFAVVAAPWVGALSAVRGRLTFGDSARYNYVRFVNGTEVAVHWQGGPPRSGIPIHPTRRLLGFPAVYEFATPLAGTYPPWTDPQYWYEGAVPHVDARRQLAVLAGSARVYGEMAVGPLRWPILGVLVLLMAGSQPPRPFDIGRRLAEHWPLLVLSAAALVMFALVIVLPRYVAPWLVVVLSVGAAAATWPRARMAQRLALGTTLAVPILALASTVRPVASTAWHAARGERPRHLAWEVADELRRAGVARASVGFVGQSFRFQWARLAGSRVVAEIRPRSAHELRAFWTADAGQPELVAQAFRGAGVVAVVADTVPPRDRHPYWHPLGSTGYSVRFVARRADPLPR